MSAFHFDSLRDRDLSYEQECAERQEHNDDLARIVPPIGEAESEAAGVRNLEDYAPASGLWYGADLVAKASAGGARKRTARGPHVPPGTTSPDDDGPSQPAPSPVEGPPSPRRGEGSEPKEKAA